LGSTAFSARLRDATGDLHTRAERSGFVADMLRGRAGRAGYALLLRNLLPVYRAIEDGLTRQTAVLRPFARPELYRARRIEADLMALCGQEWPSLLPAGARYAARAARAANGDGTLLIAHAYVRTLGDLSGGQMLGRLLARTLALPPEALNFYDFSAVADIPATKAAWRSALDAVAAPERLLHEARVGFRLNIALSEAVRDTVR
jgi:heme oxygenase